MSCVRIAVNKHGHSRELSSHVAVQQGGGVTVAAKDRWSHSGADNESRNLPSHLNTAIIAINKLARNVNKTSKCFSMKLFQLQTHLCSVSVFARGVR